MTQTVARRSRLSSATCARHQTDAAKHSVERLTEHLPPRCTPASRCTSSKPTWVPKPRLADGRFDVGFTRWRGLLISPCRPTRAVVGSAAVGHGCGHQCEEGVCVGGAVDDLEVSGGELVQGDPPLASVEESLVVGAGDEVGFTARVSVRDL